MSEQAATKTKKQLCELYGISRPTLRKWLNTIPLLEKNINNRIFNPAQLKLIYAFFGDPNDIKVNIEKK